MCKTPYQLGSEDESESEKGDRRKKLRMLALVQNSKPSLLTPHKSPRDIELFELVEILEENERAVAVVEIDVDRKNAVECLNYLLVGDAADIPNAIGLG